MNTQLKQPHLSHPPEPLALLAPTTNRVAGASWLDRAAMRVGLWLVLWGSRPVSNAEALARHRHRAFLAQERAQREAEAALATRLWMHGA
ncbi:hypothetical protein MIC448_510010 [Microbacterium sp. C448]|nr:MULTISPECIES: hypothetical protein [Microbacterium]CDK01200.1 hypothetical protein MIC448_510010 [Microbacterium sp. C448]